MGNEFTKYHGLGNDFVLLDRTKGGPTIDAARAMALCDRHRGIGADGVLTLLPEPGADLRMHIWNSDGSEAEMCGNGIRCVARYAVEARITRGPEVRIATAGGLKVCTVHADMSVTVDMGAPELERQRIPVAGSGRMIREKVEAGGRAFDVTAVSMGNPHAVIFGEASIPLAEAFGPKLETRTDLFPNRTNVEFAAVRGGEIDLVVWERGCGITQACGTGACATAVAATVLGLLPEEKEIPVHLPGGTLGITVTRGRERVLMRGPATRVFEGTLSI